ncbi:MAG: hypothetical protein HUK40_08155 [Desulfobacter sp.]|nr:hypothetical protein [Desulfobacter sp.]
MEFGDLVTYILLFLFFVLPSILKKKGKKKAGTRETKKNASVFDKLGQTIQKFVSDLEDQARQARAKQEEQGSAWDDIDDSASGVSSATQRHGVEEETFIPHEITREKTEHAPSPIPAHYDPDHPFLAPEKVPVTREARLKKKRPVVVCSPVFPGIEPGMLENPLQQAVVWSEILGKPVALRDE